jgi:hypothetical protein
LSQPALRPHPAKCGQNVCPRLLAELFCRDMPEPVDGGPHLAEVGGAERAPGEVCLHRRHSPRVRGAVKAVGEQALNGRALGSGS